MTKYRLCENCIFSNFERNHRCFVEKLEQQVITSYTRPLAADKDITIQILCPLPR